MENIVEKWNEFLEIIERDMTAVSFDLWIKTLRPLDLKNDTLIIATSSPIAKAQIHKSYSTVFDFAFKTVYPNIKSYDLLDWDEEDAYVKKATIELAKTAPDPNASKIAESKTFNQRYKFDNFVVGNSNQFVYAAARAVAENPGIRFNPLFIYGGVGLGKTHLLQAIGNYLLENKPELKVCYVTCEKFTNDYIESIRASGTKATSEFRERYRNVDVLMIDDIQFIMNKTMTQEEFFHTFNDLYEANRQIILTSDRPPRDLNPLEDRLKSRFSSGLIQDIQSPEFETRLAILRKKVEFDNLSITADALNLIAEKINTNIRELEGFLQKVCFLSSLSGKKIADKNDALAALNEKVIESKETVTADKIIDSVCNYFNVSKEDIIGKKKNKEFVDPRQICIYLMTEYLTEMPLAAIGLIFNGRDHTTIIYSRDKISKASKINNKLNTQLNDIRSVITENLS